MMINFNVLIKSSFSLSFKSLFLNTTHEAFCIKNFCNSILFTSEICKCINNDTENNLKNNNFNTNFISEIVHKPECVPWFILISHLLNSVTNSWIMSWTIIDRCPEALEHVSTSSFSTTNLSYTPVIVSIINIEESEVRENIN